MDNVRRTLVRNSTCRFAMATEISAWNFAFRTCDSRPPRGTRFSLRYISSMTHVIQTSARETNVTEFFCPVSGTNSIKVAKCHACCHLAEDTILTIFSVHFRPHVSNCGNCNDGIHHATVRRDRHFWFSSYKQGLQAGHHPLHFADYVDLTLM